MKKPTRKGFTIIELMIATVIFSLILLLCLNALVQVSRAYYKGISSSKAQEAARALVDEITQGIQLTADTIMASSAVTPPLGPEIAVGNDAVGLFCVGLRRYTFAIDRQVSGTPSAPLKQLRNAVVRSDMPTTCTTSTPEYNLANTVSGTDESLIAENMRLSRLDVVPVAGSGGNLWQVNVAVVYGDTDLLVVENGRTVCRSGTGTEFCALAEITTTVKRRFGGF